MDVLTASMLTVQCPRCAHSMRYDPKLGGAAPTVVGRRKRCVYCGTSFGVHSDLARTNIVCVGWQQVPNAQLVPHALLPPGN